MSGLPSGTITFLFTDIEGSTERWEHHPAAMPHALARHDLLLRAVVAAHGGTVFKTVGDAICAVFATAAAALGAALAAQRAISDTDWHEFGLEPLRVRMALHTGVAEQRDGDYFGRPLNRVARLLAASHGGQIVLSLATEQLVRDELPPTTFLRDLGTGGLRGLVHSERVYQLVAPDLPTDFPPLKALDPHYVEPLGAVGTAAPNPYKGLRAFQAQDAADFFGREALTDRLLGRLAEPVALVRFLAVVGPSGSGKSSVVRAGVIPALGAGRVPGSAHWRVVEFVPGAHPLEELEAGLINIAVHPPESLINQLREDERGLIRAAKRVLPRDETTELVLVIDQFEEIFTLVADEPTRVHFLMSLHAAVRDPRSRIRVLITLRADFYDRPLLYPDPGELVRQRTEVVLPLSADELEQAIVRPAARQGVSLEPELLATLFRDVGEQPGMLPLLQYALTELFERRQGRRLTLAAYTALGGIAGALSRRADELYGALTAIEQALARQLFLRLVTLGEGVEDTRRRAQVAELDSLTPDPALVRGVLEQFGRYRLLTFDRDSATGERSVEVAHEALIQRWDRLREWLESSREAVRLQRRLAAAANEWAAMSQDPSFLASGARLVQFMELAANPKLALNADERSYIEMSIAERDQQAATERERQAHELALAQEAERAQRRAATRLRSLAIVLLVFLLVAVGLSFIALNQRAQAVASLTRSEAQRLAAEATVLLNARDNADVVALLSIRSLRTQYTLQGDAALEGAATLAYAQQLLTGHTATIRSVAYSPDGRYLLTGGDDRTARLWDAQTGAQVRVFTGHTAEVWDVAYAPDGRSILTGSFDSTTRLWDVQSGRELRTFTSPSPVESVAFSPDGALVLTGHDDKVARLWNAETGEEVRTFSGHTGLVLAVAFSHDGQTVLTGSTDTTARLWNVQTGAPVHTLRGHTDFAWNVAFSPDDTLIATGSPDRTARLWDAQTGVQLRTLRGHTHYLGGVAFAPDGRTLVTGSQDKTARLWDVATGQELRRFTGHTSLIWDVAFAPDGRTILTGGFDRVARVWDVQVQTAHPQFTGHEGTVAAVSPDGTLLLTGSEGATAWLWDAHTGHAIRSLTGHTGAITAVAFAPDGRTALTGSADQTARLWDVATGQELRRLEGHGPLGLTSVAFSPDGTYVLTGGVDFTARLYNAATGQQLRVLQHTNNVFSVAFSPDGTLLLTGGYDKTARLWDTQTGAAVRTFTMPTGDGAASVAFSPDGTMVLTGSWDGTIRLWQTATGAEIRQFNGHSDVVWGVAFSHDGKFVLSGSQDTTGRLWDTASGTEVRRYGGNPGAIMSVAFAPDGQSVLTGTSGSTARLWDVDAETTIHYLCGRLLRDLSSDERAQYGIQDQNPTCLQAQAPLAGGAAPPR